MQTDTVVGIVGAVVLVSVMVGVFAYEYNATDGEEGLDTVAASMDAFNATYPGLAADGDLDNDGILNYEDSDLDGDGTPNMGDSTIAFEGDLSGVVAASTGSAMRDANAFHVDQGAQSILISISYDRPAPLPGAVTQQPGLDFTLVDSEGISYESGQAQFTPGSATVTLSFELFASPFMQGEWTLTASSNSLVATSMTYTANLTVGYDVEA